jgi:hypothetical protein
VVGATQKAEAGGPFEPKSLKSAPAAKQDPVSENKKTTPNYCLIKHEK